MMPMSPSQCLTALVGAGLLIYHAYLICLKKIHLGIILPLIIGVAFLGYAIVAPILNNYLSTHPFWLKMWGYFIRGFWLWVVTLFAFFGVLSWHNKQAANIPYTPSAIIVLGSKASQGTPSPALAMRLDSAAFIANTTTNAYIVTTGGVGFGETISEAKASKDYLISYHHIAPERILLEDKSTSTALNLSNSLPILAQKDIDRHSAMVIVTSDFHTLRVEKIAKKQGLTHATVVGAPTPLQTRYQAWLREYFAFISGFILKEY